MNKNEMLAFTLVAASFAATAFFYGALPQKIAIHWNASGVANGFGNKDFAAFFVPAIALLLLALLAAAPKLDPLGKNIEKFKDSYCEFKAALAGFLMLLQGGVLAFNLGNVFDFNLLIIPGLAGLFFFNGRLLENSRRNWFIGIRTPWTMSNEKVWEKTNALGAKLFKAAAIISLLGIFAGPNAVLFAVMPAIAASIALIAYSYVEFQKVKT